MMNERIWYRNGELGRDIYLFFTILMPISNYWFFAISSRELSACAIFYVFSSCGQERHIKKHRFLGLSPRSVRPHLLLHIQEIKIRRKNRLGQKQAFNDSLRKFGTPEPPPSLIQDLVLRKPSFFFDALQAESKRVNCDVKATICLKKSTNTQDIAPISLVVLSIRQNFTNSTRRTNFPQIFTNYNQEDAAV